MQTKTISVTRTVVCPLETSQQKNDYLREAIEEYQSCLAKMADMMPSVNQHQWQPQSTPIRRLTKKACDTGVLYANDRDDAGFKVAEAFSSKVSNGHGGELPEFGDGDYIRTCSCCTKRGERVYLESNERGYGLHTKINQNYGKGRYQEEPVWFHVCGGQYQYEQLERIVDGEACLGNIEIHLDEGGHAEAHISYSVDVEVPKKGEAETYVGVDVGDRTLYAVAVCDSDGTVQNVEVESGDEQRHHRDRLLERQKRRQQSGPASRGSGVSDRQRYTEQVMHTASRRIVDVASEHAPCAIVIEDLTNYREDAPNPIHDWPFAMLQEQLCYKANARGIRVIEVNPEYTSLTCRQCGVTNKQSRDGLDFECVNCGYEVHADVNAAINIAARGYQKDSA